LCTVAVSHDPAKREARTRGAEDGAVEARGGSQNPISKAGGVTARGLY